MHVNDNTERTPVIATRVIAMPKGICSLVTFLIYIIRKMENTKAIVRKKNRAT
jgi:hypothetical protein